MCAFTCAVFALAIGLRAQSIDLSGAYPIMDEAFQAELERFEMPGGALAVVVGRNLEHLRGFGYSDLAAKIEVDPETTLFYLASLTKPFTALSVLQSVERGLLDLETDVNEYLPSFRLPDDYREPITLHHLLTHTAGLDDRNIGYVARSSESVIPLERYLAETLLRRVIEPGRVITYSNHGYGLAGHLVELTSGLSFADYLEQRVFNPLGMTRSTADPLGDSRFASQAAVAYFYNALQDRLEAHRLGYRNLPPAGSISATASDMARFLLFHLNEGVVEGVRIAEAETVRRLQGRQFGHHPALPGMAYGFWEMSYKGRRYLSHEGGFVGAAALISLFPELGVGIFAVVNQNTPAPLRAARNVLLEHLFPGSAEPAPPNEAGSSSAERDLSGDYILTRYSRYSMEKLAAFDQTVQVDALAHGALQLEGRLLGGSSWEPAGGRLFREKNGSRVLAFLGDEVGITHFAVSLPGIGFPAAFEKAGWNDSPSLHLPLVMAATVLFISCFTLWPIWGVWTRFRSKRKGRASRETPWFASVSAATFGILFLGLGVGLDAYLGSSVYRIQLIYGMTSEMVALLWVGIVLAALAPLMLLSCWLLWKRAAGTLLTRIYYSALSGAAVYLVFFLHNWNLLGFRY